jgi:hypothetical protein
MHIPVLGITKPVIRSTEKEVEYVCSKILPPLFSLSGLQDGKGKKNMEKDKM